MLNSERDSPNLEQLTSHSFAEAWATISASLSGRRQRLAGKRNTDRFTRPNSEAMRVAFVIFAVLLDALAILASAIVASIVYHRLVYGERAELTKAVDLTVLIAAIYLTPNLIRGNYGYHHLLTEKNSTRPLLETWILAFLGASAFAFIVKTGADMSRGATVLFFLIGGSALVAVRSLAAALARHALSLSTGLFRRVLLVGYERDLALFSERYKPWSLGMEIVTASVLRGWETIEEDLRLAVAAARIFRPDDVFILAPWHEGRVIDACVDAFMRIPASIHLGPERVLDRFSDASISRIGVISSLRLVRRPLNFLEVIMKRLFDLVVASGALLLLSPLLLIVAVAIKVDSKGPALFRQRRYGFNQEPFFIVKFRSLTVMEDHAGLRQVTPGDKRVTRVGRLIRRTNIDELPQLVNVLMGHMSLVGPRPHALAHDHLFGSSIAIAARRHNVKPGITGWAQIHGYRGEFDTEEKLRGRIEHDLYYIDNWSLWLDLRILALTVISREAYKSAY